MLVGTIYCYALLRVHVPFAYQYVLFHKFQYHLILIDIIFVVLFAFLIYVVFVVVLYCCMLCIVISYMFVLLNVI